MMIVIQETFANISETLIHMKQLGTFNDILMSPISRLEIIVSFLISTLFIGLFVAIINYIILNIFVDIDLHNFWRLIFYLSLTSLFFACIGGIIGFVSYTWDVQQGFFNFMIVPISLLSGTFFSIEVIHSSWKNIFLANPFYHLVSNIRKTFNSDQTYNLPLDLLLIILLFFLIYITLFIYKQGYRVIN